MDISVTVLLTCQLSLSAFLLRPHFSCATMLEQDERDVPRIINQKSRHLVFLCSTSPPATG